MTQSRRLTMPRWTGTFESRFWDKVEKTDGCWWWKAFRMKNGYGMYGRQYAAEHSQLAHHYAWEFANGRPVPEGLMILHRCNNRGCVNPEHLYAGTNSDNQRDKVRAGRHHNCLKTHCPHGHPYSPENTRILPRPDRDTYTRTCLTCYPHLRRP